MPIVVAILNQKGGSGKTTIATNLAAFIHNEGNKILLVDADPQGSTRDWKAAGDSPVPVVGLDRPTLAKDLPAISSDYDIVLIDGAPSIKEMAIAAIRIADYILVPVQPSPYDIWATADLIELIKARQEVTDGIPKASFIVNRTIKNTKLSQEISDVLKEYEIPVFSNRITQRVIYASSAAEGKTVIDSQDKTAIMEIKRLVMEFKEWL